MRFDELNEDNYILFAIKNYDNPQAATKEDFFEDMRRFKYIKRLLKKYHKGVEVKLNLLLNHIIIIYNVFGDAAPLLLFYKMERDYWSDIKAIMVFLNKLPTNESDSLRKIAVNECILEELKEL
tara:strand:- start:410 stop:781 length:372 start_codon:yes stop_codon:yes gene_type:complete